MGRSKTNSEILRITVLLGLAQFVTMAVLLKLVTHESWPFIAVVCAVISVGCVVFNYRRSRA
jgi:hypothetical protein